MSAVRALVAAATVLGMCACQNQGQDSGFVEWDEAESWVGESAVVCGPLQGLGDTDGATFLNLGLDYPEADRFTIVIWEDGLDMNVDQGDRVCGRGEVSRYEGVLQMEFDSQDEYDYALLGEPESPPYP
jgi:hypothetical protein